MQGPQAAQLLLSESVIAQNSNSDPLCCQPICMDRSQPGMSMRPLTAGRRGAAEGPATTDEINAYARFVCACMEAHSWEGWVLVAPTFPEGSRKCCLLNDKLHRTRPDLSTFKRGLSLQRDITGLCGATHLTPSQVPGHGPRGGQGPAVHCTESAQCTRARGVGSARGWRGP